MASCRSFAIGYNKQVIKVTAIKRNVAIVVHGGWWMVYGCQQSAMSHRPSTIDCTLKLRLFAVGLI